MSARATNKDETDKISEYIRKMAPRDKVLGEYLRQQKPDKEQHLKRGGGGGPWNKKNKKRDRNICQNFHWGFLGQNETHFQATILWDVQIQTVNQVTTNQLDIVVVAKEG